jgi:hypothetical protein
VSPTPASWSLPSLDPPDTDVWSVDPAELGLGAVSFWTSEAVVVGEADSGRVEDHLFALHLLRNASPHCEPVLGSITYQEDS